MSTGFRIRNSVVYSTLPFEFRGALSRSKITALSGSRGSTSPQILPRSFSYDPVSPNDMPPAKGTREVIWIRVTRASAAGASTLMPNSRVAARAKTFQPFVAIGPPRLDQVEPGVSHGGRLVPEDRPRGVERRDSPLRAPVSVVFIADQVGARQSALARTVSSIDSNRDPSRLGVRFHACSIERPSRRSSLCEVHLPWLMSSKGRTAMGKTSLNDESRMACVKRSRPMFYWTSGVAPQRTLI